MIRRRWTRKRAARRSITPSCTSSPWLSKTAAGITKNPTRPRAPRGPGRSNFGIRYPRRGSGMDPALSQPRPQQKAFGGRVVVTLKGGSTISDEIAVADAHPLGARPFTRPDYIRKFRTLAEGVVAPPEQDRFIAAVERLPSLRAGELPELTFAVDPSRLGTVAARGIFDWQGERTNLRATRGTIVGEEATTARKTRAQEIRRAVGRRRRQHRALQRRPDRQRPALPRLRHPRCRRARANSRRSRIFSCTAACRPAGTCPLQGEAEIAARACRGRY